MPINTSQLGKRFFFLNRWFKYKITSRHRHGHGIHSPFVYHLLITIIEGKTPKDVINIIEPFRKAFLRNSQFIKVYDLGAGSTFTASNQRKINNIAAHSATCKKHAQMLWRLINHFKPPNIIELGTSLGVTTHYLAIHTYKPQVYTLEGSTEIAKIATKGFVESELENIRLVEGDFSDSLSEVLNSLQKTDFVYFDGNHRKEPTLAYFEQILPYCHNDSVLVFGDIHLSQEMEEAWKIICSRSEVKVTVDLFYTGLVFFKKESSKQNFVIRF